MAISSVAVLNANNVSASFAQFRESSAEAFLASLPEVTASAVSHISPAAKTLVSLESFQASAGAVFNSLIPPTVSDFKALIQGVVGAINSIRSATASAPVETPKSDEVKKRIEQAERIAEKSKQQSEKLRELGVDQSSNGSLVIDPAKVENAYFRGGVAAFDALASFVDAVTKDKEEKPDSQKVATGDASNDPMGNGYSNSRVFRNDGFNFSSSGEASSVATYESRLAVTAYSTVAAL